jgi:flagellin
LTLAGYRKIVMALTVTNTNSLTLLNILNRTSARQSNILTQLTTGKRINKGSDDPAGLIALEALNAELTSVNAGIINNQRTDSQLSVADSALGEVSSLLSEINSLVSASSNTGGLSAAEINTNQAQIDSAITAIDRIIRTTSFNGKRLLDGSLGINTTGVDSTKVTNLRVFTRPEASSAIQVTATITASAQTASAAFGGDFNAAGTNINTSGTSQVTITGTLGTATLTLGSGLTRSEIITAVNAATSQTGVSATVNGTTNNIDLDTTGYGSDEFISVNVISGGTLRDNVNSTTSTIINSSNTKGVDATVTVNGQTAQVDGLDVNFTANGLSFQYSLATAYGNGSVANRSDTETFNVEITGGATFQLGSDTSTRQTIGLNAVFSQNLGGGDAGGFLSDLRGGGTASLVNDPATALKTIKKAVQDLATERGRIGAFQKFQVRSSINALEATKTQLTAASSIIGDTDFAAATAALNRESVLLNSGISLLGLANQQTSQILSLLG